METCVARASAAIVQHVPPAVEGEFKQWQRGVTESVEQFPGYQGTDLYPPIDGRCNDWVSVIHFDNDQSMQQWLDSPMRARWVANLRANVGDFELKTLTGGFSEWFSSLACSGKDSPASWKMALTVLFGLYPIVMLLLIFVVPYTSVLGTAFSMLVGNALSVSTLQWIVMPALTRVLRPWLEARPDRQRLLSIAGLFVLVLLLVGMAVLFRRTTG